MTTILAVDDSRSMRQLLGEALRGAGYCVVEAQDGVEALQRFDAAIDVVLTDQHMPRMDGVALTRALRERGAAVPVLILTTEADAQARQAGRAAGATGWLVKPFDPATLIDVIARVTTRSGGS